MKMPINYSKINGNVLYTHSGNEYVIEVDHPDYPTWVYREACNSKYCLAFIFDWDNGEYSLRKAINLNGMNWEKVVRVGKISKRSVLTMDNFIFWITMIISQHEDEYN